LEVLPVQRKLKEGHFIQGVSYSLNERTFSKEENELRKQFDV
jgi:hypothetical protein